MKQYTTKWAKEVLRLFPQFDIILQRRSHGVPILMSKNSKPFIGAYKEWAFFIGKEYRKFDLPPMLEHPDGWQNSKVTREDL